MTSQPFPFDIPFIRRSRQGLTLTLTCKSHSVIYYFFFSLQAFSGSTLKCQKIKAIVSSGSCGISKVSEVAGIRGALTLGSDGWSQS